MRDEKNKKNRSTVEWIPGKRDNIGIISPLPTQILDNWLSGKDISKIINMFWSEDTKKVALLDVCALMQFWWKDKSIVAARYTLFTHPEHHKSEIILDKSDSRAIIEFRQPDIDGKHWRANHIHIIRGEINPSDKCKIKKPNFDKHIELFGPPIRGVYIQKVR